MAQSQPAIFSQIASRFFDIVVLIIGALLGFVSSWVVSKRERKEARADQRRERIYGPLHDELDVLEVVLSNTQDVVWPSGRFEGGTYERVKTEHIRYMIPRKLRGKIIQLYEESLPNYEINFARLREKYRAKISENITKGLAGNPHVANLSTLTSMYLLQDKIPDNIITQIGTFFYSVKQGSYGFTYANWKEYFEYWKNQMYEDTEFKQFEQMRKQIIENIQEINETIQKDLESEN
jgi:hypothetical protein